jgi:hypothetical protein
MPQTKYPCLPNSSVEVEALFPRVVAFGGGAFGEVIRFAKLS